MPTLKRHKAFLKDYAHAKLTDTQFEKLVLFLALLKEDKELPPESKDHALKGNWKDLGSVIWVVMYCWYIKKLMMKLCWRDLQRIVSFSGKRKPLILKGIADENSNRYIL